ncbi:MAG: hypothetical protein IPI38_19670 [Gemmatimonadetes bacterium]|nr:hypothetical protein [Gemmatimonadota bacterium]
MTADSQTPSFRNRIARSLAARWRTLRAAPLFNPLGRAELARERAGGHPGRSRPSLPPAEAIAWGAGPGRHAG